MQAVLAKLSRGETLSRREAADAVGAIMDGAATPAQIASFLTALRMRGETADEILGAAEAMRARVVRVRHNLPIVADTCGTGGDGRGTFNFSTLAALIVAACGVPVAKHGNRAASSKCGSADLLEALGVRLDLPAEDCLRRHKFAFLFAPAHHPAVKHAAPVRRELGFRTLFNLLGPICNPAFANVQSLGVFDPAYLDPVARALAKLGTRAAIVYHGAGMDELTPCGDNDARIVRGRRVTRAVLRGADFGLKRVRPADLAGGDPATNSAIARDVLAGKNGAIADVCAMNASAALVAAGAAKSWKDGVARAREAIASGAAMRLLEALRAS